MKYLLQLRDTEREQSPQLSGNYFDNVWVIRKLCPEHLSINIPGLSVVLNLGPSIFLN